MTNALIAPSCQRADGLDSLVCLDGQRFCTELQPSAQRVEWLKEVIGREYANVDIKPSQDMVLFNDMWIYPWQAGVRLSPIQARTAISWSC